MPDPDLFGLVNGPHTTPKQRRALSRRKNTVPNGYAWKPGTGPTGETCGSCQHHVTKHTAKRYHKCGLMHSQWTCGALTDIRVRSSACAKWEKRDE